MMNQGIQLIFNGVETKRFHTVPTLRNETVGHHQGMVVALLLHAYPHVRRAVVIYAALHDLAEHVTGDTPSPVKKASPEVKHALDSLEDSVYRQHGIELTKLDQVERNLFKRCDNVAGMLSCWREYMMGNVGILVQFTNFKTYYDLLRSETAEKHQLENRDWHYRGHEMLNEAVAHMANSMGCRNKDDADELSAGGTA